MYNTYITFANIVRKKRYPKRSISRKFNRASNSTTNHRVVTDSEFCPANCASECIRPIVSVIPYEAGPAAIFDFLCTTFEIIMNWLSLRKVD